MDYRYDPEADVLAIFLSKRPFDYAKEMGNFIVHFDKKDNPVYVEILDAEKFLTGATKSLPRAKRLDFLRHVGVA